MSNVDLPRRCVQCADAGGVNRHREKVVEGDAKIVQQGGPDRFGVADDHNGPRRRFATNPPKMIDDPPLHRSHAFSAWGLCNSTLLVPVAPTGIPAQFVERKGSPVTYVDFIEFRCNLDGAAETGCDDSGRLDSAPLRARLNLYDRGADHLAALRDFLPADLIDLHARHPAAEPASQQGMMSMAYQMDDLGHADQPTPSMNARVSRRASSSVY